MSTCVFYSTCFPHSDSCCLSAAPQFCGKMCSWYFVFCTHMSAHLEADNSGLLILKILWCSSEVFLSALVCNCYKTLLVVFFSLVHFYIRSWLEVWTSCCCLTALRQARDVKVHQSKHQFFLSALTRRNFPAELTTLIKQKQNVSRSKFWSRSK